MLCFWQLKASPLGWLSHLSLRVCFPTPHPLPCSPGQYFPGAPVTSSQSRGTRRSVQGWRELSGSGIVFNSIFCPCAPAPLLDENTVIGSCPAGEKHRLPWMMAAGFFQSLLSQGRASRQQRVPEKSGDYKLFCDMHKNINICVPDLSPWPPFCSLPVAPPFLLQPLCGSFC